MDVQEVAALERANYEATLPITQVTPGLDLLLTDNVIFTSSEAFPSPDTTHACLLRGRPDTVDDLIDKVVDYFSSRGLPTTIFVSPACTPSDLPKRLSKRGFDRQEKEAWMVADLSKVKVPKSIGKVAVQPIAKDQVKSFVDIFMTSFEMPLAYAPGMIQLIEPSVGLPGVYHFLGYLNEEPVATFSLICYKNLGIIGSAGVVPAHRRRGIISDLAIEAAKKTQEHGGDTLLLQTSVGVLLERWLGLYGFRKLFTRVCYTLPC